MPHFFSSFPNVAYDIHKNKDISRPVNIVASMTISAIIRDRMAIYYNYSIQEGDRPDIVAHKYYGDETLDWIILLTNNIINPLFDWPLDYQNFVNFISNKYGQYNTALTQVHHYNKILREQQTLFDGTIIPKATVQVDLATFNSLLPAERETITALQYEEQLNDAKRDIHILDRQHVETVLGQAQGLF